VEWSVPTLNQAMAALDLSAPLLPGSMRGFAVPESVRIRHPQRATSLMRENYATFREYSYLMNPGQ